MKVINTIFAFGLVAIFLLIGFGCDKNDDGSDDGSGSDFNRKALLENTASNIVIPNYQDLVNQLSTLKEKTDAFTNSPGKKKLDEAQQAFKDAYVAWQHCSTFDFGPANNTLRANVNTFPVDIATINNNITTGNYDFSGLYANDEKGFPALDYLLFGKQDDQAVIDSFTNAPDAQNRKTYLNDVVKDLQDNVESVHNDWQASGGNYIEEFVNNTGTGEGSSLSFLVNELSKDWEIIKDNELGIPVGEKSIDDEKFPKKVQALYSEYSIKLALEHAKAIENIFLGRARSGADGKGFDEYLQSLDAQKSGKPLAKQIREQFGTCKQKIQAIPSPLSKSVNDNESKVKDAFDAVLRNLAFIKTDMASALGVQITYQDNDGD